MKANPADLHGVLDLATDRADDERGSFFRTFDIDVLRKLGVQFEVVQASTSTNRRRHTLRGLHHQRGEAKVVRCTRGAVFDVVVDLRPDSPTHLRWLGRDLDADGAAALYIPAGCAHGFLTRTDDAEVSYLMDTRYVPADAGGVRWDDPAIGVAWPARPAVISERDANYPDIAAD